MDLQENTFALLTKTRNETRTVLGYRSKTTMQGSLKPAANARFFFAARSASIHAPPVDRIAPIAIEFRLTSHQMTPHLSERQRMAIKRPRNAPLLRRQSDAHYVRLLLNRTRIPLPHLSIAPRVGHDSRFQSDQSSTALPGTAPLRHPTAMTRPRRDNSQIGPTKHAANKSKSAKSTSSSPSRSPSSGCAPLVTPK